MYRTPFLSMAMPAGTLRYVLFAGTLSTSVEQQPSMPATVEMIPCGVTLRTRNPIRKLKFTGPSLVNTVTRPASIANISCGALNLLSRIKPPLIGNDGNEGIPNALR